MGGMIGVGGESRVGVGMMGVDGGDSGVGGGRMRVEGCEWSGGWKDEGGGV